MGVIFREGNFRIVHPENQKELDGHIKTWNNTVSPQKKAEMEGSKPLPIDPELTGIEKNTHVFGIISTEEEEKIIAHGHIGNRFAYLPPKMSGISVLPERRFRRRGYALKMGTELIKKFIQEKKKKNEEVGYLTAWSINPAGHDLMLKIAEELGLKLYEEVNQGPAGKVLEPAKKATLTKEGIFQTRDLRLIIEKSHEKA